MYYHLPPGYSDWYTIIVFDSLIPVYLSRPVQSNDLYIIVSTASAVQTIVLAESSLHHRRPHVILNIYSVGLGVDLKFFF